MKKIFTLILLILLGFGSTQAQYLRSENQHYDLSLSSNGSQHNLALSAVHLHPLGKKQKFSIGYGLRLNLGTGSNTDFWTAPAKLTSGKTGPGVFFSDNIFSNFDTIHASSYFAGSLNASIHLNYRITSKWQVEFNIDAVGLSFGSEINADYKTSKRAANQAQTQKAKPTPFNLLLISDNDIGNLNSELFVAYSLTPKWGLRAGATFIFTEYTTENKLYLNNDRFRNKALMGMIGIRYTPNAN